MTHLFFLFFFFEILGLLHLKHWRAPVNHCLATQYARNIYRIAVQRGIFRGCNFRGRVRSKFVTCAHVRAVVSVNMSLLQQLFDKFVQTMAICRNVHILELSNTFTLITISVPLNRATPALCIRVLQYNPRARQSRARAQTFFRAAARESLGSETACISCSSNARNHSRLLRQW